MMTLINKTPMAASIKRDADFNKELASKIEAYWAGLGHTVKVSLMYDSRMNIHRLITEDLKNGLPHKEKLTPVARKRLTKCPT